MTVETQADKEDAIFADATERGRILYERLRPLLEPAQDSKAVAIHVDSGDHAIADSLPEARRQMRLQRPEGMVYSRTIGVERDSRIISRLTGAKF